jgi:general secretion pathway protein K
MSRIRNKGGALLAVLWLSAALSAIAFAVANTVRTETLRTSNEAEGVRTHYLAQGSVERALLWVKWGMVDRFTNPDGSPRYYQPPMPYLRFNYPSGVAVVEMIPESARVNVNIAEPESIRRILLAVGANPEQAAVITQGILSWRTEQPAMQQFLPRPQTFGQQQASFRETEELLLVNGMTPELFYGKFERDPQGRLFPRGGLRDCLTVYGNDNLVDPNTASPEMFLSLGFPPQIVNQIVTARRIKPFKTVDELNAVTGGHPAGAKLRIGDGGVIWTVRATARLKLANGSLSDLARTVAASVTFYPTDEEPPYRVLRWRDEPWTPSVPLPF